MTTRMDRREQEKAAKRQERNEKVKSNFQKILEERRLAKKGQTNKKRSDKRRRFQNIDTWLTRIIVLLVLANLIVWLFIFFV